MDPLSDGSSRSHQEERWRERCGTESGFRHPREISASKQSSQHLGNASVFYSARRQAVAHLGADAQVRIRHEIRLLVRVFLPLHVGVDHADADAGQRQNNSQYLPGPRCGKTGSD